MKNGKLINTLLYVDSHDSIVRVLQSWRLWVVGAIVGALLASAIYFVFPPMYRARAVVVVDHNLEEVWAAEPGNLFYFLGRETRKLEALAWNDETLGMVADQVEGVTVAELREKILFLSQQSDGTWNFYADQRDADRAEQIASTWANVFVEQVIGSIEVSAELMQAREEINEVLLNNPNISQGDIGNVVNRIYPELYQTDGISPFIEVSLSQGENLAVTRSISMAVFTLSGSVLGALGIALAALVVLRAEEKDDFLVE
jgi:capsular polysaccharide biosynthesis protein